jgi:hypothetical protein
MRRLPWVLAFVFIAGCADDPKQPEPQPRRQAVAQPQPQPQSQPPAQADPPADDDNTPIVIKGSHKSDGTPKESDAARQKRIDDLKAQAKASEGQDNGPTYREAAPTDPTKTVTKKDVKAQIANLDERIKALQEQKRNLPTSNTRHGPVITDKDQEASLNQQINDLEQQKIQLLQQAPDAPPPTSK